MTRATLLDWARRGAAAAVTAGVGLPVGATTAAAAEGADRIGQTPPALTWITLTDSRGISIWNYELSVDRGGVMSPDTFFWASVTDSCWGIYRSCCALALWFLDWVLSFGWLQTVAAPLLALGDAMGQVVGRLGLVATFLTINALLAGLWLLRGRYATAIWEVGIAAVIAALAAGVFAHPVTLVAGPNGYITTAAHVGQELAAGLATGDAAGRSPAQLRAAQTGQLVDTFIRQPTQIINFGQVLDGTTCEAVYDQVISEGPHGTGSQIRDAVGACDPALGQYAAAPSSAMAIGSLVFMPAAFVILALALVLAGSVIAAALWAMFQALKAVITLVTGLLPGGGRGSLMLTIAETVVALLVIVFTSVFLSVFLLVIQAMFAAAGRDAVPRTFVIVDALIVAGIVVYARQHRQLKATSQRLAGWLAHRPGAAPATRLPDRPLGLGVVPSTAAVRTVVGLGQLRAARAIARRQPAPTPAGPTFIDNRTQATFFSTPGGGPRERPPVVPGEVIRDPDPPTSPPGPQSPGPGRRPGGGSTGGAGPHRPTAGRVVGALARAGTSAALAYATGGASTAAGTAARTARAVQSTRRAAVTARIAAAAITGPATPTPPASGQPAPARPGPPAVRPPRRPAIPPPASAPPASGSPAGWPSAADPAPADTTTAEQSPAQPRTTSRPVAVPEQAPADPAGRLQARLAARRARLRRPGGG